MSAAAPKASRKKSKPTEVEIVTDPAEVAEEAGLRYVSDHDPGYSRKPKGDDFEYFDTEGKPIRDEKRVLRIRRLAIPPAYKKVWICPSPNGHIQATGRDDRGRKQYRYHERWREARDENKFDRLLLFGKALPAIRRRAKKDIGLPGLVRDKILGTLIQLLERTFIRVGNEEYARENKSFGLTTMQNRHVDVTGGTLRFRFRGKSGVRHDIDLHDQRIAKIISKLQHLPGQEVFQYLDDEGTAHDVSSQDVNDYLREISGEDFTAKDFRTWAGTVLAATALNVVGEFENKTQAKKNVKDAISAVSKILGNTPSVCRKCYVHPAVLEAYLKGDMIEGLRKRTEETLAEHLDDLRSEEAAVMSFLQTRLEAAAEKK